MDGAGTLVRKRMTKRVRRFEIRGVVLAIGAMVFCALAQLILTMTLFFGPSRGELPAAASMVITVLTFVGLVFAARKDGVLLKSKWFLGALAAFSWIALCVIVTLTLESPWELMRIPQWGGGSESRYLIRRGVWRPLHVLHALGPIALVLAASARKQPRAKRTLVVLSGVVPWALGSALYAYLLSLSPPIYMG